MKLAYRLAAAAALGTAALAAVPAAADTITFDGTGAPCNFSSTSPLTTAYAGQGVTFSGVGGAAGSILNQCGNFGLNARSGTDFLAFNTAVGTAAERFSFTPGSGVFQLYVGSGLAGVYTASYYDGSTLLEVQTLTPLVGVYGLFSRTGFASSVVVSSTASYWVADDFSFRLANAAAVPEPATWALMLVGFGAAGFAIRRAARRSEEAFDARIRRIAEGSAA